MLKDSIIQSKWDKGTFETTAKVNMDTHEVIDIIPMNIPDNCKKLIKESIIIDNQEYNLCDDEFYNGLTKKQKAITYFYTMEEVE